MKGVGDNKLPEPDSPCPPCLSVTALFKPLCIEQLAQAGRVWVCLAPLPAHLTLNLLLQAQLLLLVLVGTAHLFLNA